jgi:hypothetical protein
LVDHPVNTAFSTKSFSFYSYRRRRRLSLSIAIAIVNFKVSSNAGIVDDAGNVAVVDVDPPGLLVDLTRP